MVRAVTFDFWNTLMWEEPGSLRVERIGFWADEFKARGTSMDRGRIERAHDAAHSAYEAAWRAGRQFRVEDAAEVVLAELGTDDLGNDARDVLLEGYDEGGRRAAIHPSDGVAQCLQELRGAGLKVGIVCDIGLTPSSVVRELLEREALIEQFDHMGFSDESGFYKPTRQAFEHALHGLGHIGPQDAAHVGDRRRTDVGGALAIGMTAVRYKAVYDDPDDDGPEAPIVTDRLAELPALLGVTPVSV